MPELKNRILVYSSSPRQLRQITEQFQRTGGVVATALTGGELRSLLEEDTFDAVIVADDGTGRSVPQFLPEIRRLSPDSHLVAVRDGASRQDILESLNGGCSYFIETPGDNIAEITAWLIDSRSAEPYRYRARRIFSPHPSLSAREREVLLEMLSGKTNRQIGETLHIHEKTVKNHLWKIYRKYGIDNRTELFGVLTSESPYFRPVRDYIEKKSEPVRG
jgi:DNA-binding NarL/FixJ family response regulator